jgi:hypothetical protein
MAEAAKAFEVNPFAAFAAFKDNTTLWNLGMQQLQAGLKAHAELLGNAQSVTETCLRHRRQNLEDAVTAVERMCACKDLGEATAIQQKWLSDCMQSLMEDFTVLSSAAAIAATRDIAEPRRAAREIKVAKAAS